VTWERVAVAVLATGSAIVSLNVLPHPWDAVLVCAIAGFGTLYETPKGPPGGVA
jgi:hypothetical protein